MEERTFFGDGTIKGIKTPGEKFGQPFYLITIFNQDGKIQQIMEKPNLKLINPLIHVSGSHIMPANPEQNHIDHFNWKPTIERPKSGIFTIDIMSAFIPLKVNTKNEENGLKDPIDLYSI